MNARRCQGCGASLPDSNAPESLRCRFCGLAHDAAASGSAPNRVTHVHITTASLKPARRWVLAIVLLIVIGTLVPVIAGLYFGWRAMSAVATHSVVTSPSGSTRSASTPSKSGRLVSADLRTAAAGTYEIDAAPPSGGFAAVDAVTALPWALTIAQGWASDARLERIDITRMRPDGTVNVQDDAEAWIRYRFRSPARAAALLEQTRLTTSARGPVSLFLIVQRGTVRASVNESRNLSERDAVASPHPSVLPLAKLAKIPAVEKVIADIPFVNGYAIHLADEGWVWYFSTLANETRPRVRGRDGAVWPFPRTR